MAQKPPQVAGRAVAAHDQPPRGGCGGGGEGDADGDEGHAVDGAECRGQHEQGRLPAHKRQRRGGERPQQHAADRPGSALSRAIHQPAGGDARHRVRQPQNGEHETDGGGRELPVPGEQRKEGENLGRGAGIARPTTRAMTMTSALATKAVRYPTIPRRDRRGAARCRWRRSAPSSTTRRRGRPWRARPHRPPGRARSA